jgi:oligopeptide transport system permease protein
MYFIKRILFLVPLLLLISFLAFVLVHAMPGGPFDRERAPASPEIEHRLLAKYHLDEPILKQYLRYLNGLLHGDFGPSMKYRNHSVTDIIAAGLPVSLSLGALAFCLAMGIGLPLGFFTAVHKARWEDYAGQSGRLVGDLRSESGHRADSHHALRHQMALVSGRAVGLAVARHFADADAWASISPAAWRA